MPKNTCQTLLLAMVCFGPVTALRAGESNEKMTVSVMSLKIEEIAEKLVYPTRISSNRSVSVQSEIDGSVSRIFVQLGQKLRVGAKVIEVKNPDPVYSYNPFIVRAPISGYVNQLAIAEGDRITKGQNLLVMNDDGGVKISINLIAEDMQRLGIGDKAELRVDDKTYPVSIAAMSPFLDSLAGTASCDLRMIGQDSSIVRRLAGRVGYVTFVLNQRKAYFVPDSAIIYRARLPHIVKIGEDLRAKYVPIKILKRSGGRTEISGSLKEGERIMISSSGFIRDNESILVQEAGASH